MRVLLLPAALLALAVTGCAGETRRACTLIAATGGIEVEVAQRLAARADRATLTACWAGSCRTGQVREFVPLSDLPAAPVRVTLRLSGPDLAVAETTRLTPEVTYPNGPGCPPETARARVRMDVTGTLRAG
ncbi:hypothetical protein FB471_4098 [Amycolatopsis cihanbeyliensis]|uniref:Lipoprotein n=1 Tax=Amycolatopsis cihanbeyliensis TaxID=1128664 RepID=A0A542DMJ1_AMYCI|nr:hypothetical protein FB471_4098 [Amycolatopsis cihanbeyliensis]